MLYLSIVVYETVFLLSYVVYFSLPATFLVNKDVFCILCYICKLVKL